MDIELLTLTDWLELGSRMTPNQDMRELRIDLLRKYGLRWAKIYSTIELRGHVHDLTAEEVSGLVSAADTYGGACVRTTWGVLLSGAHPEVVSEMLRQVHSSQFVLPGQGKRKPGVPQRTIAALTANPRIGKKHVEKLVEEGVLPDYVLETADRWDKPLPLEGQLSTTVLKLIGAAPAVFQQNPNDAALWRLFFELWGESDLEPVQAAELAIGAAQ